MPARPIRLGVGDRDRGRRRHSLRSFDAPLRFGYGTECCDVCFEGDDGPQVLFELARTGGPIEIRSRVGADALAAHADLTVDGRPLRFPVHALRPGSRLDIHDKSSGQRYQLVVDPPPFWFVRPRFIAAALVAVTCVGAVYGVYLFQALSSARSEIGEARVRMVAAESRVSRRLDAIIARLESTDSDLHRAVADVETLFGESDAALRREFDRALDAIRADTGRALEGVSTRDRVARDELVARTRERIERLRADFARRFADALGERRQLETRLHAAIDQRLAARGPGGGQFKALLESTRERVVLVRTRYEVESPDSAKPATMEYTGTGFLVDPSGIVLTAQHVLFPWRYERETIVLQEIGMARVRTDSVRWTVWLAGSIVEPFADSPAVFGEGAAGRRVEHLFSPEIERAEMLVGTPLGLITVQVPVPGPSDVAVVRLHGLAGAAPSFDLAAPTPEPASLDQILVVGFPFQRLQEGRAVPQGVHGFVRLRGAGMIELDTPLHPGISGAPVLDAAGRVVGMATATLYSEIYGMAVGLDALRTALAGAR